MTKTTSFIGAGVIISILMSISLKVMNIIDPLDNYETGIITMLVTIFVGIPLYIISAGLIIIGIVIWFKEKNKNKKDTFIDNKNGEN